MLSIFDEAWDFSDRTWEMFHQLIPPPTQRFSARLITSHAGSDGSYLHTLYKRGLTLPPIGPDLYGGDGMHHWQNEKWLEMAQRDLPPHQFRQMILNEFASSEDDFVSMQDWDACVDPQRGRAFSDQGLACFCGIDASTSKDATALAVIGFDAQNNTAYLLDHKIITPSPGKPIDFKVVEQIVLNWHIHFKFKGVFYDYFQMTATAQKLAQCYIPVKEYSPTHSNLTAMAENFSSLVRHHQLRMYPEKEIREAITGCILKEERGQIKIARRHKASKIDIIIAMAMACIAAKRTQTTSTFIADYSKWGGGSPDDPRGIEAFQRLPSARSRR